jgi:hypothetical protein
VLAPEEVRWDHGVYPVPEYTGVEELSVTVTVWIVTGTGVVLLSVPVPEKLPLVAVNEGDEEVSTAETSVEGVDDGVNEAARYAVVGAYGRDSGPPGYTGIVLVLSTTAIASATLELSSQSSCLLATLTEAD